MEEVARPAAGLRRLGPWRLHRHLRHPRGLLEPQRAVADQRVEGRLRAAERWSALPARRYLARGAQAAGRRLGEVRGHSPSEAADAAGAVHAAGAAEVAAARAAG